MKIKLGYIFIYICLLLAGASQQSYAEIRIATNSTLSPYFIEETDTGIVADIIQSVFESMGEKIEFVYMDNNHIQRSLIQRHVTGAFNFPYKKTSRLYYSTPIVQYHNIVVTHAESKADFKTLECLANQRVGAFQNARNFMPKNLQTAIPTFASYVEFANQREQVKAFLDNRLDAIILEENIFKYHLNQIFKGKEKPKLKEHHIFEKTDRHTVFLSKELRDKFNRHLSAFRKTPEHQKIFDKYLNQ